MKSLQKALGMHFVYTFMIKEAIERFHHVIKNDVGLHNSVIPLRMTPVLVYK